MSSQPVVIYHANCLDGFGSAYAAYKHFGMNADYIPAHHGEAPPECRDREVYILDFSYKRDVLQALCEQARSVVIVDHHISAREDLQDLEHERLQVHFDMEHSGAVLSWRYFHDSPPPQLLLYVQDRDLWRFELIDSNDVNAALMSHPFEFVLWDEFANKQEAFTRLRQEGKAINRYRRQLIDYYKERAVMAEIAGFRVPVVNCPSAIASDVLGELAEKHPFAAGYQDKGERRSWSLRSRGEGGEDVARIAALFGGGGHRNAAGFGSKLSDDHLQPPQPA